MGQEDVSKMADAIWDAVERLKCQPGEAVEALVICIYNMSVFHGMGYEEVSKLFISTWARLEFARAKKKGGYA